MQQEHLDLELTTELKSLRNNDTWLLFMQRVSEELPFLYEPGRPSSKTIHNSVIGRSGHASWGSYIKYGLDWSESGWRAWRRAYNVVQKFPYLEKINAKPSLINLRSRTEDTFPPDVDTWNALTKALYDKKHESRLDKLEKRIATLETALKRLEKRSTD